ncbi:MAG TPA: CHASE4 domain-containing protein, partial [Pseudolabrys sp.]|nr:CHASE4 domain-containing protein [Pseudolabrys sp.]
MPSSTRQGRPEQRPYSHWDRARLSVVVPIGAIVAVAIVCIVVAVLSSARRADEVSLGHERQLLNGALATYGGRMLRDLDSVATSGEAVRNIRDQANPGWMSARIAPWIDNFLDHDALAIFDAHGRQIFAVGSGGGTAPNWLGAATPMLGNLAAFMHGEGPEPKTALRLDPSGANSRAHIAILMRVLGRPAVIAAAAVAPPAEGSEGHALAAPVMMAVKFVDRDMLDMLAHQLRINDLRPAHKAGVADSEVVDEIHASDGSIIARFAWRPKQPGSDIVHSVAPFITVALAGFALLAAFVLRYMRRTAATIASGESRLRFLAMHDPL